MRSPILKIAIPSIIANIAIPLLSFVDIAIMGHFGAACYIGAISVGGMLFSLVYWAFGFLRASTGGLTAQFYGEKDFTACAKLLRQSLFIGFLSSLIIILLRSQAKDVVFLFLTSSTQVKNLASIYYGILIFGAPAVLCLYCINGWFIGMQNARYPLYVVIVQNVSNIILSLFFVYALNMGIQGIALGTLLAQYLGLFLAIVFARNITQEYNITSTLFSVKNVQNAVKWSGLFSINKDIFLRTLGLIAVTMYFTYCGAKQGDVILATNTILMQLFLFFSYFMDGFAYASEALCGRHYGAKEISLFKGTVHNLFYWGIALSILFSCLYLFLGTPIVKLLTNTTDVITISTTYLPYCWLIPICSFAAFLFDGVMIGITATKEMLWSMIIAVLVFFILQLSLDKTLANHALWIAFVSYLLLRGIIQAVFYKRIQKENSTFADK